MLAVLFAGGSTLAVAQNRDADGEAFGSSDEAGAPRERGDQRAVTAWTQRTGGIVAIASPAGVGEGRGPTRCSKSSMRTAMA